MKTISKKGLLALIFLINGIVSAQISPDPFTDFTGMAADGGHPPDTHGAVSSKYLVAISILHMSIQTRYGTPLAYVGIQGLFQSGGLSVTAINDSKILYDRFNDRWILISLGDPWTNNANMLLAVSKSGVPSGNAADWYFYSLDVDNNGPSCNCYWIDYPYVAINANWIVITGYKVGISCAGCTTYPGASRVFFVNKSDAYNGTKTYTVVDPAGSTSKLVPAQMEDNSTTMYLIEDIHNYSGGVGHLGMYIVGGTVNAPTIGSVQTINGTFNWTTSSSSHYPENNATAGLTYLAVSGSTIHLWVHNVVYRNGSLWVSQNIGLTSPTRISILWSQINPANLPNAIVQSGLIDDATGNSFFTDPSIAVNYNSDVLIGYTLWNVNGYPGAAYSYRNHLDLLNTLQNPNIYEPGEVEYDPPGTIGNARWGDMSATLCDPDLYDFWTIQECSKEPEIPGAHKWETRWARIGPAAPVCMTDIIINYVVLGNPIKFEASHSITASSVISSNSDVAYDASAYIILDPGFMTDNTSLFRGYIEVCGDLRNSDLQGSTVNSLGESDFIQVWPNPFANSVNFHSFMDGEGTMQIDILDLAGKTITSRNFVLDGTQDQDYSIDLGTLPSGVFIWRATIESKTETGKLVKAR